MTEDTSPENLRKFLESDDPAMVQMGLSLAEGSGVSNEMLVEILWMYMMHDDKTIRAAAKSTFMKIAPEDAKLAVKKNWKASYRTEWANHPRIGILGKALHQTSVCLVERLIKEWEGGNTGAVETLGIIGDARAVEPLIKAIGKSLVVRHALVKIGEPAVEPLIKALKDEDYSYSAAKALGEIGDKRAVEPLIKALEDDLSYAASALRKLGHEVE
jgi:hypothetical protein